MAQLKWKRTISRKVKSVIFKIKVKRAFFVLGVVVFFSFGPFNIKMFLFRAEKNEKQNTAKKKKEEKK